MKRRDYAEQATALMGICPVSGPKHEKGASMKLDAPISKNKLPGRLPLSDRAFAFLVTPKTPVFTGEVEK
jgi:hypothetical protein